MPTHHFIKEDQEYEVTTNASDNVEKIIINHKNKWNNWKGRKSIVENLDVKIEITPMDKIEEEQLLRFLLWIEK